MVRTNKFAALRAFGVCIGRQSVVWTTHVLFWLWSFLFRYSHCNSLFSTVFIAVCFKKNKPTFHIRTFLYHIYKKKQAIFSYARLINIIFQMIFFKAHPSIAPSGHALTLDGQWDKKPQNKNGHQAHERGKIHFNKRFFFRSFSQKKLFYHSFPIFSRLNTQTR